MKVDVPEVNPGDPWYVRTVDTVLATLAVWLNVLLALPTDWWEAIQEQTADLAKWVGGLFSEIISWVGKNASEVAEGSVEIWAGFWGAGSDPAKNWITKWANKWKQKLRNELLAMNVSPADIEELVGPDYVTGEIGVLIEMGGKIGLLYVISIKSRFASIIRLSELRTLKDNPIEPLPPADSILAHRRLLADQKTAIAKMVDPWDELGMHGLSDHRINALVETTRVALPIADALRLHHGGLIEDKELVRQSEWNNIEPGTVELFNLAGHVPLSGISLYEALWRGHIDDDGFRLELAHLGHNDAQTGDMLKLAERIPQPADLVRMSVREAFDPAYIEAFDTMRDFPVEFGHEMQRQGYNDIWSKRWWASHWVLPSMGMGFDMFHRKIIDGEQLRQLMHAQDIMPWWRPKLEQLSHRLLTRVDIRRMHKLGILDYNATKDAYARGGYSELDAGRMADFTVEFNSEGDKDLTKAEVLKSYRRGILNFEETAQALSDLGYDADESALLLNNTLYELHKETSSRKTAHIRKLYFAHAISIVEVAQRLTAIPIEAGEITWLVDAWSDERVIAEIKPPSKETLPSKAELIDWVESGTIGEQAFKETLRLLGYQTWWVGVYWSVLDEATREKATAFDEQQRENDDTGDSEGDGPQGP